MDEGQIGFCCSRPRKVWEQARGMLPGLSVRVGHTLVTCRKPDGVHAELITESVSEIREQLRLGGSVKMHERGPILGFSQVLQRNFSVASPSQLSSSGIPLSRCYLGKFPTYHLSLLKCWSSISPFPMDHWVGVKQPQTWFLAYQSPHLVLEEESHILEM